MSEAREQVELYRQEDKRARHRTHVIRGPTKGGAAKLFSCVTDVINAQGPLVLSGGGRSVGGE